jgi:putative ABC transport system permease protein
MLTLAWRGVRFNLGRYVATLVAIITGVAFFAASGFVADRVVAALEGDADRQYGNIDAAVVPDRGGDVPAMAADRLRIDGDVADEIEALPQVEAVAGELTGDVAFLGVDGGVVGAGATGRLWVQDEALNPTDLERGAAPVAPGEIAVDRGLAAAEGLDVGDEATILTLGGQFEVRVTGITRFGSADAQDGGGTVSIPPSRAFDWLNAGQVEYEALHLRGAGSQTDLVEAVAPLAPPGFTVQSGDAFLAERRNQIGSLGTVLKRTLQFFAALALLVGGFVIYNTFNVIVAQRTRELAVLAAIGATPGQLKKALRLEALVVGLVGSVLGVIAGLGLTFVLIAVLERLGVALPGSGIRVAPGTVVLAVAFGVVVTRVSVLLPARRAGRAEPIEALRQADASAVVLGRGRVVAALVIIVVGGAAMLLGSNAVVLGLGTLVLFVGVILVGPLVAVIGGRLLRPVLGVVGLEGRLAADNTARNPQRTATTANALLVGVFLVTFVSVAGTSAKDYAVAQINELSTADFTIESTGGTIDDDLVADLEAVEGVEVVTPFRREAVAFAIDGEEETSTNLSTGVIEELVLAAGLTLEQGSFEDLGPGDVVLVESQARNARVGATATFTNSVGVSVDLEVVGVAATSLDSMVTGAIASPATFDDFVGETAPTVAFIKTDAGTQSDAEDAIGAVTALRPDITLQEGNLVGRLIGGIFDFVINAVNGLLLMSIVIALIGIVNTLTLSIMERRRELGILRVTGMVDRRVRRMVRIESVVVAGLGTVSGMALGVFAGSALISAIDRASDAGIGIRLPPMLLGSILVLGLGLGFLAAVVPARRSTRLDLLDAIQAT